MCLRFLLLLLEFLCFLEKFIDIILLNSYNNNIDEQSSDKSDCLGGLMKQSISVEADATKWLCCMA